MIKRISALLMVIVMAISMVACAQTNQTTDSENEKITFVLDWTPNTNHTGIYVAIENGYYDEVGLDVDVIQPPEGGAVSLVAAGNAQFCIDFQEYLSPAITGENGMEVSAVAAILQHNTSGIISLKEDGIESPKDMAGKTYATWDMPIEKAILKEVITSDGGNYDDVKMVPNTVTDVIAALQTDIDAVWIYYGWDGIATEVKGLDTDFFYFKDIEPVLDNYSPVIVANNEYLAENGDQAKAFLAATAKGYQYAIDNPEESAEILLKYAPELDEDIVKASQEYLADKYIADASQWGYIDQTRWDAFYEWMYDKGVIENKIGAGVGFTNDYLPE